MHIIFATVKPKRRHFYCDSGACSQFKVHAVVCFFFFFSSVTSKSVNNQTNRHTSARSLSNLHPWKETDISLFSDDHEELSDKRGGKGKKTKQSRSKHNTCSTTKYRRRSIVKPSQSNVSPPHTPSSVSVRSYQPQISSLTGSAAVRGMQRRSPVLREIDEVFLNNHVDLCIRKVRILCFLLLSTNIDSMQCFPERRPAEQRGQRSDSYARTAVPSERPPLPRLEGGRTSKNRGSTNSNLIL